MRFLDSFRKEREDLWFFIVFAIFLLVGWFENWNLTYRSDASFVFIDFLILVILSFVYFGLKKENKILSKELSLFQTSFEGVVDSALRKIKSIEGSGSSHSFALKVAEEIQTMRNRIGSMPDSIATRSLAKRTKMLERALKKEGYEVSDLKGQVYDEGMEIDVVLELDSKDVPDGTTLISRVVKPQVMFNGVVEQFAAVEVTVGRGEKNG